MGTINQFLFYFFKNISLVILFEIKIGITVKFNAVNPNYFKPGEYVLTVFPNYIINKNYIIFAIYRRKHVETFKIIRRYFNNCVLHLFFSMLFQGDNHIK